MVRSTDRTVFRSLVAMLSESMSGGEPRVIRERRSLPGSCGERGADPRFGRLRVQPGELVAVSF